MSSEVAVTANRVDIKINQSLTNKEVFSIEMDVDLGQLTEGMKVKTVPAGTNWQVVLIPIAVDGSRFQTKEEVDEQTGEIK